MPDEAFTGAVDVVRRRIVRVRRRHGLRELARVACSVIALGAIGAAVGLALALHVGARAFTIAAFLLGAVVTAAGVVLVLLGWRRRLRRDRAAAWIDGQAGLGGRLATLVELAGRQPSDGFFLPLLVEQNLARVPSWPPERLVPQMAPRREIALAVAGLAGLALVVTLAPGWRPHGVANVVAARQAGDVAPTPDADATPERATAASTDPNTLAGLPVAIQNRLRDALWGDDWAELPPAATARAERPPDRRAPRRRSDDDTRLAGLRPEDQTERGSEANAPDMEQPEAPEPANDATGSDGAPGPGAGTGTDSNLLGNASEQPGDGHTTFELALGARVRTRRERPQRSPDEAPPAEPDARPALAAGERRVAAVHRMPVPAAYESIVRAAFAHRATVEASP